MTNPNPSAPVLCLYPFLRLAGTRSSAATAAWSRAAVAGIAPPPSPEVAPPWLESRRRRPESTCPARSRPSPPPGAAPIPARCRRGKDPTEDCALYIVIKKVLISRWTKSNTPLHCLAHSCNPRYYTPSWIGALEGRVSPHDDDEILEMRNKCLRKFFPNQDDYKTIKKEFADFSLMSNAFLNADSIEDREDFEPKQWWGTHGGSTKLLKKLALHLLGQPASSSCCERNWSTYAFIHSSARNKLTPARAADLVFTHNNHRLLSRHSREYESGPSRMWDVGGDGVESFTGVGMIEGADLSLDEPELEEQMIDELS